MFDPTRSPTESFRRFCECLNRFADQIDPDLWARSGATLRIGEAPDQIDILLQLTGVSFDAVMGHALSHDYGGAAVRFIGLDDLLANKRAAGRAKDLADVEALERTRAPKTNE